MSTVKVSIISSNERLTQQLIQNIHFYNMQLGEVIEKPREAYMQIHPKEPRIIVFAEPEEQIELTPIVMQLKKVNAGAPVIFLSRSGDFERIREMYRAGVTDVLRIPDELEQLESMLEKASQIALRGSDHRPLLQHGRSGGKIISVYSSKGGAGTTTVSVNTAQAMALQNKDARVLLIDLNLQFGGIQHYLDIEYERNLGDLKSVMHELTFNQLSSVLYKLESSNLHLLMSPAHPQEAENFTGEDIELLFNVCRQNFDYIILDLPRELNEVSISAISQTDQLVYVLNLDRSSILSLKSILNILDRYHLIDTSQIALIINKYSRRSDVTREDVEKIINLPVLGSITEDVKGKLQTSANLGMPLIMERQEKLKSLKGLVKEFIQLQAALSGQEGGERHVDLPRVEQQA
ncbi:AAA family ATPase [Paenibacillus kandeliae]|uniref:AAA family ATPase n=1 Tax=Paenibacillus kandeliae TaxID=3231269 RepID=UPI0034593E5E